MSNRAVIQRTVRDESRLTARGFPLGRVEMLGDAMSSTVFRPSRRDVVSVLTEDRDLAGRLEGIRRERAESSSAARVLRRPAGIWTAEADAAHGRDGLGLLVIEGTLVRRVGLAGRQGAELLSAGDLLQPAEHDGEEAVVPFEATWRVLSPLRLAVLDLAWMARMSPYPEVFAELTRRVMQRSRRLAALLAIAQHHRLEDRLQLLFWELADRYGRVGPDGVRLDIPLTHDLISHLVGAHRPSVSTALSRLEQAGDVERDGRTWTLHGPMPSPAIPELPSAGGQSAVGHRSAAVTREI
jgi:CRP/FNR family cyclic AMP-dependent transcriptional regulator